jgi:predicted permease
MRTLTFVECAGRAMLRLAPPSYRRTWESEVVTTLRDSCLHAHRRRGWRGLIFAGLTELSSVGDSVLRSRIGGGPTVTMPGPGSPLDPRQSRTSLMPRLHNDLRLAFRALAASRTSAAIAVLTLALGIGVNAAVFSILDSTLFRPVPFADADRYTEIWTSINNGAFTTPRSRPSALLEWRKHTDLFERIEGYEIESTVYATERGAEMLTGAYVTPGLMSMLGVRPLEGRLLGDGDGRADSTPVVVISEGFWREQMHRAPDAVGQSLTLGGIRHQIVGIAPASFRFPNGAARIWLPHDPEAPAQSNRSMAIFVRLAPGISLETATAQVKERGPAVMKAAGAPDTQSASIYSGFGVIDRKLERSLAVMGGAVAFLLLIICANLANLSLSRTLTRARDFAVRASIGASRGDLIRESFVEHALVGLLGAAGGLLVARLVIDLTLSAMPEGALVRSMNAIDLDGRALAFTAAAGIVTAVLFGLPPALIASRARVADALRLQSRGSAGSVTARRLRAALVVAEVSLAIVLLAGAALMARSFVKLVSVDRGFDTRGLVTLRVGLPAQGFTDPYMRDGFTDAMIARVGRISGVRAATAGGVPPESSLISFGQIDFERAPGELTADLVLPIYQVWPGYFDVVGIPLRAGRGFREDDPRESVIVSESFARQHFPSAGDAVGQRFRLGTGQNRGTWRTIVGVAGEVRQLDLDDAHGSFEFYYPLKRPAGMPAPPPPSEPSAILEYRTIVARADDPDAAAVAMRAAVSDVDPRVVVWMVGSVERDFADAIARPRLVLLMLGVFAAMGLVLAAAGIYGVLSYLVAQRRREIGIRLALGAVPASVGRFVLGSGMKLTAIGVVLGIAAALSLVRVMQTLLYEVEASDPLSMAAVVLVLVATALIASWWPARRAMRVNPLALIREE